MRPRWHGAPVHVASETIAQTPSVLRTQLLEPLGRRGSHRAISFKLQRELGGDERRWVSSRSPWRTVVWQRWSQSHHSLWPGLFLVGRTRLELVTSCVSCNENWLRISTLLLSCSYYCSSTFSEQERTTMARSRANGEGSVWEVTKGPSKGRFRATYWATDAATGRRKRVYLPLSASKTEAKRRLATALRHVQDGTPVPDPKLTH